MDSKAFEAMREQLSQAPMNRLLDIVLEQFKDFENLINRVGLRGQLKESIITGKMALDELYGRIYSRHHFNVDLKKENADEN